MLRGGAADCDHAASVAANVAAETAAIAVKIEALRDAIVRSPKG
jgi:hypothetical protein